MHFKYFRPWLFGFVPSLTIPWHFLELSDHLHLSHTADFKANMHIWCCASLSPASYMSSWQTDRQTDRQRYGWEVSAAALPTDLFPLPYFGKRLLFKEAIWSARKHGLSRHTESLSCCWLIIVSLTLKRCQCYLAEGGESLLLEHP